MTCLYRASFVESGRLAFLAGDDGGTEAVVVRSHCGKAHTVEEVQCKRPLAPLLTCTDQSTVADHIVLHSTKKMQGLLPLS